MHSDARTLSKASIWREASRIVYEEGFRAFWKGNLVTIVHRLPYSAISFYAYERYKTVSKDSEMSVVFHELISIFSILSFVAVISCSFCNLFLG